MLKSTHQARPAADGAPPLPSGWTEHKAPTGHPYYYNADTKLSTYTRPTEAVSHSPDQLAANSWSAPTGSFGQFQDANGIPLGQQHPTFPFDGARGGHQHSHRGGRGRVDYGGGHRYQDRRPRNQPEDNPRSKHPLPGHSPWLLVKTKFGRRFLFDPDKSESFWRIPDHLKEAVEEFGKEEKRRDEKRARGERATPERDLGRESAKDDGAEVGASVGPAKSAAEALNGEEESDEYEEVEVTDDEDEDGELQRQRLEEQKRNEPQEFNEDDIAFQLAAMGQDYGLDPGEYGDGEGDVGLEEGAEGLPLTEEDSTGLFKDLLDDHGINPYSTWEKIIEEGKIIEDNRYTVLPNMKSRKEVWGKWSRDRIQRLKEAREKEEKKDPRIPYLAFLQKHATPKLYWPEFRRKYKKEPDMRDAKLSDKDREKWYREYISRMKLPESTLKSEFTTLLNAQPLALLNRSTDPSLLPPTILTDIRYISLKPSVRDPLVSAYISTLVPAPADAQKLSLKDEEEAAKRKQERGRREKALAERGMAVAAEKRRQWGALEYGRGRLREEEEEIERAMRVGKEGLKAQLGAAATGRRQDGEVAGD